jgi:hypothetical protein
LWAKISLECQRKRPLSRGTNRKGRKRTGNPDHPRPSQPTGRIAGGPGHQKRVGGFTTTPVVPNLKLGTARRVDNEREGCGRGGVGGRPPIGGREGRDNGRKDFPRLQRFPAQKTRRDQRRVALVGEVAEGREKRRGTQVGRAGLMIRSVVSHGCSPRPNSGGAARDDGLASMPSKGWGPRAMEPVGWGV